MPLINLLAKVSLEGTESVTHGLGRIRQGFHEVREGAERAAPAIHRVASAVGSLGQQVAQGITALSALGTVAGTALAVFSFNQAASMEAVTRGLATVSTGAGDLTAKLARLQETAKLPGLNFEQVARGTLTLQASGLSATLAERSIKAFGNALASVGKGANELEGVITALSQIQSKGVVSAEEINQIAERVPQIRRLLAAAFGTADTEKIQAMGLTATQAITRIVAEAEKLPQATGSIGTAVENLGDRVQRAVQPLGRGLGAGLMAISPVLEELIDRAERFGARIGQVIEAAGRSGVLAESLRRGTAGLFDFDPAQVTAKVLAVVSSLVANLPQTFRDLGAYIGELFNTVAHNGRAILSWITNHIKGFVDWLAEIINSTGQLGKTLFGDIFTASKEAGAKWRQEQFPTLKALPTLTDAQGNSRIRNPLADVESYQARILAAIRPQSQLPSGLVFAEGQGMNAQAKTNQALLGRIAQATEATAEALGLSRQIFGGGERARIGVTPAEMRGGSASPTYYYGPVSPMSEWERLLRTVARDEGARGSSGGRLPR